jgi:hypothetical protein
MTDQERIDRLEQVIVKLCWALARQGTDADGNYGHKSFGKILSEIVAEFPDANAKDL